MTAVHTTSKARVPAPDAVIREAAPRNQASVGAGAAIRAARRTSAAHLGLIAATWMLMTVLVDPVGDFPVNDDWVYAAAARSVLDGHFEVYSFASANVGVLAYWGALFASVFGFSHTTLRASTSCLALAGIVVVYFLVGRTARSRTAGLFAALTFAVNPIFFSLSCTFMTDVPFFALLAMSMLALVTGIEEEDGRRTALGLAIAFVALTMRQFAVVVFVGYLFATVGRRGLGWRSLLSGGAPLAAGLLFNWLFTQWLVTSGRKPYPGGVATLLSPSQGMVGWLKWSTLTSLGTVGLCVIPLALLCFPVLRGASNTVKWRAAAIALLSLLLGYAFVQRGLSMPIGENILRWYGIGPLTNTDTLLENRNLPVPEHWVTRGWDLMTILTVFAASSTLVATLTEASGPLRDVWRGKALGSQDRRRLFVLGVGASYLGFVVLLAIGGYIVFDRYLLPLALIAALSLPGLAASRSGSFAPDRARIAVAAAALVVFAVFTTVGTHDFLAWSRTRWNALQALVHSGVSPHRIDGGYEFDGTYLYDPKAAVQRAGKSWWVDDDEYLSSSGPMPGYTSAEVHGVDRWWKSAGRDVFILHR